MITLIMVSFPNPFKKKDSGEFKLDDYSLPSISDSSSVPPLPDSNQESSTPNLPNPTPNVSDNDSLAPQASSQNNMASQLSTTSPYLQNDDSYDQIPAPAKQMSMDTDVNNIHNEVSRVKIDSMEAKINLIEARMTNLDHKVDLIIEMLKNEISDETRRKLRIDSAKEKLL